MIEVKLSSVSVNGSKELISQQTPCGKGVWGEYKFFADDEITQCDYWVVFDTLSCNEVGFCPPNNTIFVAGEPKNVKTYNKHFLKQFATVITSQDSVAHNNVINTHHVLPWFVKKSYDELIGMTDQNKSNLLSIVTSNKRFSAEHEQRYQFALAIKKYFGNAVDLYGRGIRNFDDKWDVLAPYKYSIAIENFSSKYYATEKLTDCFLSYTFPFYYGCTNLEDYYPKGSYQYIDITDVEGSISIIQKVLQDSSHYEQHFDALCAARFKYLNEYQIFPNLAKIIARMDEKNDVNSCKKAIHLSPSDMTFSDLHFKGRCLAGIIRNTIDSRLKR